MKTGVMTLVRFVLGKVLLKKTKTGVNRPEWEEYFFGIAESVSKRASCPRASVGCVLVRENRILSTGYNGSPQGTPHCTEAGCQLEEGHCQRALHAEVNAIAYAARAGVSIAGASLYLYGYDRVCRECTKVLKAAGIDTVFTRQG
jgi:dCMP deaminase